MQWSNSTEFYHRWSRVAKATYVTLGTSTHDVACIHTPTSKSPSGLKTPRQCFTRSGRITDAAQQAHHRFSQNDFHRTLKSTNSVDKFTIHCTFFWRSCGRVAMKPNSKSGRPPKLTPPVTYEFRYFFDPQLPYDKIIDLMPPIVAQVTSVAVDPLAASSSGR